MLVISVVILLLLSLPIVPRSMVNASCVKMLIASVWEHIAGAGRNGKCMLQEIERVGESARAQTRLMFWPHFEFIAFRGYCLSFKTTITSISSGSDVAAAFLLFIFLFMMLGRAWHFFVVVVVFRMRCWNQFSFGHMMDYNYHFSVSLIVHFTMFLLSFRFFVADP